MPIRASQVLDVAGIAELVSVAASAPRTHSSAHARWVRVSHWILAASIFTLAFTGFIILMAHPRLYWGETGNGLTCGAGSSPRGRYTSLRSSLSSCLRSGTSAWWRNQD
jgi:hypothetical protein